MLGGASSTSAEERARGGDPVGGGLEHFQQLGPGEGFVSFRQNPPDDFSGGGERNKHHLPIVAGHPIAAVGDLGDGQFDRPGAGRGRAFQYQLSLRSAGGTGSTWPVSCAGIFIDFVGMKKVPISMAPTPVSMITREAPWTIPTV